MDEAEEVFETPFVANHEAAEVVKPGEQPLDLPAPPVAAQRAAILGAASAIGAVGRNKLNSFFL